MSRHSHVPMYFLRIRNVVVVLLLRLSIAFSSSLSGGVVTYNNYQYDMTVPQFTPDGRLLQVEYAKAAADRSFPIMIIPLQHQKSTMNDDNENDNDAILLVCTVRSNSRRLQDRLVLLPLPPSTTTSTTTTSTNNYHSNFGNNNNNYCLVAMSGILPDCLALLLDAVTDASVQHYRDFGVAYTATPAQQLAQFVSNQCLQHAISGGIRPFGASLLILSTNNSDQLTNNNHNHNNYMFWMTDPSGAINVIPMTTKTTDKNNKNNRPVVVVVGGSSSTNRLLQKRFESEFLSSPKQKKSLAVADQIQLALVLVKKLHNELYNSESSIKTQPTSLVEAVLVSNKRGFYKMSCEQIEEMITIKDNDH